MKTKVFKAVLIEHHYYFHEDIDFISSNQEKLNRWLLKNVPGLEELSLCVGEPFECYFWGDYNRSRKLITIRANHWEYYPYFLGRAVDQHLSEPSSDKEFDCLFNHYMMVYKKEFSLSSIDPADIRADVFARTFTVYLRLHGFYWDIFTEDMWKVYWNTKEPYDAQIFYDDDDIMNPVDISLFHFTEQYFDKLLNNN